MKNQALFSSKDKSKKLNCRLLQFLFGTLRVKKRVCIASHPSIPVRTHVLNYGFDTFVKAFWFCHIWFLLHKVVSSKS